MYGKGKQLLQKREKKCIILESSWKLAYGLLKKSRNYTYIIDDNKYDFFAAFGVPGQPPTSQQQQMRFPTPQQSLPQQTLPQQPVPAPGQPGYTGQPQQNPSMTQQQPNPQQQYGFQGYSGQNPQQQPQNISQAPWNQQQQVA